jgi:hypothetical protein
VSTTDTASPLINTRWWPGARPHVTVAVFILAVWGASFGMHLVARLTPGDQHINIIVSTEAQAWVHVAFEFLVVAALCWFAVGATDLGLTRSTLRDKTNWGHSYGYGVITAFVGVIITANIVVAITGATATAVSRDDVGYLPQSIMAGPTEELAVAGMIILMERARWHIAAIYATIVALRVGYHLWYGLPVALAFSVWAAAFVWIFLRYRNVAALAAAHVTHNMIGYLLYLSR